MDEDMSQVPRVRRSRVWEHYEQDLVRIHGDLKAVCKKNFLLTMKKTNSEGPFVFDQKVCRDLMVKFCIHAEIPILKFEDPYLQPWIDSMQPAFQVMGHHTIHDDAMKMYKGMKKDIKVELQNLDSRICLTSDMWTSS
ncbi:unnamed protein product [Triticum turgidum subsp. durum]|uniref:Uncharacterized protein n=1 Tax=Triticum turgidum subsp. durum TaxID=4567 RepID=A0A9R0V095_TRITD|nr:unnamed protein product [Triticum turgidum subsp. durum]